MALFNFRFFALHYLNDWCDDDRRFVEGLRPNIETSERLKILREAASYYGVSRTLPTLDGEERLTAALAEIDAIEIPINEQRVDEVICRLANQLEERYGRYAISAASKFLWLRQKSPIVIWDDRADKCLRRSGCQFARRDYYRQYRQEWRKQFADCEKSIRAACAELVDVKAFSLAAGASDEEIGQLISAQWFHERVFDKFLWWNSAA